jgi:RNA polymerase sigma factor (sigma-70 family)
MEEYRVDLKVRNNLILSKIESMGYNSPHHFCKDIGLSYTRLLSFTNMQESIFDTRGKLKPFIEKLCDKLKCIPEEIFSAAQMEISLKTNKRTFQIQEAEMKFLMKQNDNQKLLEELIEEDELKVFTEKALDTLTPKEKKVIQMRFGLGEYEKEYTLDQVGEALENYYGNGTTSRERVRQIEAKALRKLRHPLRSDDLRGFIDVNAIKTEKDKQLIIRRKVLHEQRRKLIYDYDKVRPENHAMYDRIQQELLQIENIIGDKGHY